MNITKKDITVLNKIGKAFKSDFFMIKGNMAVNITNNNIVSFVTLLNDCNIRIPRDYYVLYKTEEVSLFESVMTKTTLLSMDNFGNFILNGHVVIRNYIHSTCEGIQLINTIENHILIDRYNSVYLQDIRSNLLFELAISNYENKLVNLGGRYLVSLHKGLLPINKADKVHVTIKPIDEYTFICIYHIDKKSFIMNVAVKYIYLS